MNSQHINLLVFDEEDHFQSNKEFLGESFFKSISRVSSLKEVEQKLINFNDNDLIFLIVHVFYTNEIKGIKKFKVSNISEKYPKIGYLYVSDGPRDVIIEEMTKRELYDIDKFRPYYQIKTELSKDDFDVFTKKEILKEQDINTANSNTSNKNKKGIFLSHSSKDKDVVEKFKEYVLRLGLEIPDINIKFTSSEIPGIPAGINIPKDLKDFINNDMGLFIQFISQDYLESRTCLNEEGAAWCILDDINFISISLGKYGRAFTKESNKTISIDNKEQIQNIYEHRKSFFGEKNNVRLANKITEFIGKLADN